MSSPTGALDNGLEGSLRGSGWHEEGGLEPAAEVVAAMASLLIGAQTDLDDRQISLEQYQGYNVAMFDLAARLGIDSALKVLHIQPRPPKEGRVLLPTSGDNVHDAYDIALTAAILASIDDDVVEGSHNDHMLMAHPGTPVIAVLDRAAFSLLPFTRPRRPPAE